MCHRKISTYPDMSSGVCRHNRDDGPNPPFTLTWISRLAPLLGLKRPPMTPAGETTDISTAAASRAATPPRPAAAMPAVAWCVPRFGFRPLSPPLIPDQSLPLHPAEWLSWLGADLGLWHPGGLRRGFLDESEEGRKEGRKEGIPVNAGEAVIYVSVKT